MVALEAEDRAQPSPLERPGPLAVGKRAVGDNDPTTADPGMDFVYARRLALQERLLLGKRLVVDLLRPPEDKPLEHGGRHALGRRVRRQRALAFAIGLFLLAVAAAVTCIYWSNARHLKPIEYTTSPPELAEKASLRGPSSRPAPSGPEKVARLCGRSVCSREGYSRWASFDLR
jgi:hypothetical protein